MTTPQGALVINFQPGHTLSSSQLNQVQQGKADVVGAQTLRQVLTSASIDNTSSIGGVLVSAILDLLGDGVWQPWQPMLLFGGANIGMQAENAVAGYLRRGNTIYLWASVRLSNKGASTGSVTIAGLPAVAVGGFSFPLNLNASGLASDGSSNAATVLGNIINIYRGNATSDPSNVATDADLEASAVLNLCGWYPIEDP
ncbi:hypothetical protein JUN65_08045 [Gluconacetobacter azotocaptans]|uniref:hypothetical protein n=1 Tax=Gluconacetobacter azotocaptans TaxID=142834 RepID=UPI0019594730|nr:hypothetical protein [Gluconacetobacter azotocaptans]MBM9401536.1 hypothetical protein [Gluconacetobacter azotocaptans]